MSGDPDKCDNKSPKKTLFTKKKKVWLPFYQNVNKKGEEPATFPDDLRIIRNVRQRPYRSLAIREDRDADNGAWKKAIMLVYF